MSDFHPPIRMAPRVARLWPAILAITGCSLCMAWAAGVAADRPDPAAVVVEFVGAFNRHDVDAMIDLSHPEVRWMSVDGDAVVTETSGSAALRSAMLAYFRDVPSARSELESIEASGRFVHAVERATWNGGDAHSSQCSLSVYELGSGLIVNVWYFPAHACASPGDGHGPSSAARP